MDILDVAKHLNQDIENGLRGGAHRYIEPGPDTIMDVQTHIMLLNQFTTEGIREVLQLVLALRINEPEGRDAGPWLRYMITCFSIGRPDGNILAQDPLLSSYI